MNCEDEELLDAIRVSCEYGRIKYDLIRHMWRLMVESYKYDAYGEMEKARVKISLDSYERLCNDWRRLKDNSDSCASIYTDLAFRNKREGSVGELVDRLKKLTEY